MAKLKYWTGGDFGLGEHANTIAFTKIFQVLATRSFDDEIAHSIWFPSVRCAVSSSAGLSTKWWVSSKVSFFATADPDGTVTERDITVDDPDILGFCEMAPHVTSTTSGGSYTITWDGPQGGLNLDTGRKANGSNFMGALGQFNTNDQHGVFAGLLGSAALFSLNLSCRVLWLTDTPRTP